jgi:succinyl-CoA synthetase alpha subunit/GNAT superfamily N-acetyltransferase
MQPTTTSSAPRRHDLAVAPADVLLADGSIATLCPLNERHLDGVRALHERVSPDNLRLRFMSAGARATAVKYVEHLRGRDDLLALVVLRDGGVVALGTAEPISDRAAEIALLVDDGMHGLGIGSLLLEHLAAAARRRGLTEFSAEVLVDNHAMLKVLGDAGFTERRTTANGCVEVVLDTALSPAALDAADRREDQAESRSLRPLLRPQSVAVVGVRRDGTGIGAAVLSSIREGGYAGSVSVVHPHASLVCGVPASASLTSLGHRVDLVVVAVPAEQVLDVVADAAAAGVRAAVVLSSGFGEVGDAGGHRQADLLDLARTHGMRAVGPNCLGVLDNVPSVRLNATFSRIVPPAGGLAVASQSGGLGILLHELVARLGLGMAFSVSLGNKVDVSSNDLLSAWLVDPEVTAAALYLESFGNPRKFARIARRFSREKPLLAVVGGRSAGGRRAGASHTAAAATPAVAVDALFAQAGVIACQGPEDLAETALVLDRARLPAGRRLGIVVNAGGVGVVAADQAERQGLVVPALSAALQQDLGRHVSGTSGTSTPVDAGAGAGPDDVVALVRRVAASGELDAVLVALAPTRVADLTPVERPG